MLQVPVHPVPITSMDDLEVVEQMVKVEHGPIRFISSKVNVQLHVSLHRATYKCMTRMSTHQSRGA